MFRGFCYAKRILPGFVLGSMIITGCSFSPAPSPSTTTGSPHPSAASSTSASNPTHSASASANQSADVSPYPFPEKEITYSGAINGKYKVHLRMSRKGTQLSGIYSYDRYGTDIALTGRMENGMMMISEEGAGGTIMALPINEDMIEGVWTDDRHTYPLYLIREGSQTQPPASPDATLAAWAGEWSGCNDGYYVHTGLRLVPVFDNLIRFELSAISGTHTGGLDALALVKDGQAFFFGEDGAHMTFSQRQDGTLSLSADDYGYYCGAGVSFDDAYQPGTKHIAKPGVQDVGLVMTPKQETAFRALTGTYCDDFINMAQFHMDTADLDGLGAVVRMFGVRGYMNAAIVMLQPGKDTILAALEGQDTCYYFTNSAQFAEPPETIRRWLADRTTAKVTIIRGYENQK